MSRGIFITSCGSLVSHRSALQEDTPASQEGRLWLTGQASFPGQAGDIRTVGEPSPFPGLPWDADQYNPSPFCVLAEFPNSLPLPRLRRCCPSSMMLQTGCTLGTSRSRGTPSGKRSYGQAQLCSQALKQLPSRASSSGMQRSKTQRGQGNIKPLLCAKSWVAHLASLSSLKCHNELCDILHTLQPEKLRLGERQLERSTQIESARARIPAQACLTPKFLFLQDHHKLSY